MSLWLGAVALGLGFAAMCFGVYLSFRILNFPDLTIDGSFALGGATSATLVALGSGAWPSLLPALLLGAAAGATTGLLTSRMRGGRADHAHAPPARARRSLRAGRAGRRLAGGARAGRRALRRRATPPPPIALRPAGRADRRGPDPDVGLARPGLLSEGHDARLLREALGARAPAAQLGAFNVMLSSLCHDVNALRGLIGEPARVVSCEVWQRGGCVNALLAYRDEVGVSYSFVYLPNLRSYREELAYFGASQRVRVVFPSPFLRNLPTELFHERSDDGAAAETRAIVSYEEAFEQELRAFHQNVTERLRPETDVEDSRGDLRVLTEMARKAF